MNNIPVYRVVVDMNDETAMYAVSLVDDPAVEKDFLAFSSEAKTLNFAIEDEEKHIVTGLIMKADTPIIRVNEYNEPYYVVFEKETIKTMARKFLKNGFNNNVDLSHDFNYIDGVDLLELYIKDSARGISPKGFEDITEGSLFGSYYVSDENIWKEIKEGTYKGFSIEIVSRLEIINEEYNKKEKHGNKIMSKMNKIKELLKKALMAFGEASTDKGILCWDGESELPEVDARVWTLDEEGNELSVEDGDYVCEDKTVIVVKDNKVVEVIIPEPAEDIVDEPAAEPEEEEGEELAMEGEGDIVEPEIPAEPEPIDIPVEPTLEDRVAALEATVLMLTERIAALEAAPAAEPAQEEFKKVNSYKNTGDQKIDRLNRILNA